MQYHVFCGNPGMHRGGRANPAYAAYKAGDHTHAQLRELDADPHVHIVLGGEKLTAEHLTAMEKEAAAAAEAERAAAPKTPAKKA